MQRQEQPSPLEKKGVLVDDLQGRSTLVLNSQGDNRDLSGTTSAGPGPLCAFIGSYNAFNPHVLAYVKLPLGIENHLKLRAPLTAEHSVEVYYNLQERLIFTGDERISKPDPFYSLIGHYVVFSEAAMLAARENVEQKINQQEEKSKNEAKEALEVAAEQEIIEEIGELEFLLLPEKERQQMVAQRMTAHMTAESVESRTVKVLAYHGINGESIEFLSGKNNRLILHSTYLSPDEFHLEHNADQGKTQAWQYLTSCFYFEVPPEYPEIEKPQKKVIITIHRVVDESQMAEIEKFIHTNPPPNLRQMQVGLKAFNFPELDVFVESVNALQQAKQQAQEQQRAALEAAAAAAEHKAAELQQHLGELENQVVKLESGQLEKEENAIRSKRITEVYNKVVALTKEYVAQHRQERQNEENDNAAKPEAERKTDPILSDKIEFFDAQLTELQKDVKEEDVAAKEKHLRVFAETVLAYDKRKTHRSAEWKFYLDIIVSTLLVLPSLARMVYSHSKYDTVKFWKPQSEKVEIFTSTECKKIGIGLKTSKS